MKAILLLIMAVLCFCILFNFIHKPEPVIEITPYKNQVTDSCGWCKVVRGYSLNVSCYHYGEK